MFRSGVPAALIQAIEKANVSVAKRKPAARRAGTALDNSDVADRVLTARGSTGDRDGRSRMLEGG